MRVQGVSGHVPGMYGAVDGVRPGRDVLQLGLPARHGGVHRVGRGADGIFLLVPQAGQARWNLQPDVSHGALQAKSSRPANGRTAVSADPLGKLCCGRALLARGGSVLFGHYQGGDNIHPQGHASGDHQEDGGHAHDRGIDIEVAGDASAHAADDGVGTRGTVQSLHKEYNSFQNLL